MHEILTKISEIGIVPVIKITDAKNAVPLAKALCEGGLPVAEVTFRTDAAAQSIKNIKEALPDMLVGAGTVLTIEQVDSAIDAGAQFIISPGFNPKIVKYCIDRGIPVTPGCSSPSEIEQALELGLEVVKFFPAEAMGGLKAIKAMAAPYSGIKFMPTGGIGPDNIVSYLKFDRILACGGSWMVKEDLIANGEFDKIRELTQQAVNQMLQFDLAHVGINCNNEAEADALITSICSIFGFGRFQIPISHFAAGKIEALKSPLYGEHGHFAISTNSVFRAVRYLRDRGIEFIEESKSYDDKGHLKGIYLKEQFGGFAIQICHN